MKFIFFSLKLIIFGIFIMSILILPVQALVNPADAYCSACGYEPVTETRDDGEYSLCKLPDGVIIDAWEFLIGTTAADFGWCRQQGYEQVVIDGMDACEPFLTASCAVCVLPNGTRVEVTKLMNLSFREEYLGLLRDEPDIT